MPTYQYVCTDCGEDLEVVQKFSDASLTTHDACGGKLRKVFSPVGIVFKGSGFYRTDSRGPSSASSSGANGSTEGKDGKSEKSDKSGAGSDKSGTGAGTEAPKTGSTGEAGAKKSGSESPAKTESKSSSATKVA